MKNMKLGLKLIGGFTITALIVIAVGCNAIFQQGKLHHEMEMVGEEDLPALHTILTIETELNYLAGLMRTLLTPYATKEQRETSHQGLLDTRKRYGAAMQTFLQLPIANMVDEEWQNYEKHVAVWATVNNQAVDLSKELIAKDMIDATTLKEHLLEFETAHYRLLSNLGKLLLYHIPFEGGTDGHSCALGKWLQNPDTSNSEMLALAKQLNPIHLKLHMEVKKVKQLYLDKKFDEAIRVMENEVLPSSAEVFEHVAAMNAITDGVFNTFTEMNTLLLHDAVLHQKNTIDALEAIVSKVEHYALDSIDQAERISFSGRTFNTIGIVTGTVVSLTLGIFLTLIITKPVNKGVRLAEIMAQGDMTKTMDIDQKDEIGVLAQSLNGMAAKLRIMITDINSGVSNVDESSTHLADIARQMENNSENTASRSAQVAAAAEQMSTNQSSIAAAMEQTAVNVNIVATATQEMSSTINEISENTSKAKEITSQAVNQSVAASNRVDDLGSAADQINKVTETINEISEQTNLLALNATIEAARAGEAGKGFAVVANEIKDLAKQTAEATLEIKTKIEGIQDATEITVKEINEISAVIADVDQIVATIATAVEEQSATTSEIADNVNQASTGIAEVNENVAQSSTAATEIASEIVEVSSSADTMKKASGSVSHNTRQLADVAEKLKHMMTRFTI